MEFIQPLLQAVIHNDLVNVEKLKNSEWYFVPDSLGFIPLEIAQFLGRRECEQILNGSNQSDKCAGLSIEEYEKKFHVAYRPFLFFSSYSDLKKTVRSCPFRLRWKGLAYETYQLSDYFHRELAIGYQAKVSIQWIDDVLGYGLFLEEGLPEQAFVAEYTGHVRSLSRWNPDPNAYCFQYPTHLLSNYYVVDSMQIGNCTRFINHSMDPNLQPVYLIDRNLLHLVFLTIRPIAKGTQLTFNYGKDYWRNRLPPQGNL